MKHMAGEGTFCCCAWCECSGGECEKGAINKSVDLTFRQVLADDEGDVGCRVTSIWLGDGVSKQ